MIVTPYFYPKTGGLENYVRNVATGLGDKGHQVCVVTSSDTNKAVTERTVDKLRVICLPTTFKFSNTPLNPQWYFQLKRIIDQEKPDVINAHTPVPGLADVAIYAAGNIPTVLTCHAVSLRKKGFFVHGLVARIYEVVQHRTLKKATVLIAVSDYARSTLPEKYKSKCMTVYNAIDLSTVSEKTVVRKPNRLIFIGSLDRSHAWKGLSEILKAVQLVKNQNNKIELLVLGDGDGRKQYEAEAHVLGIEKNVQFKGLIKSTKKYTLLKSVSAIIVYPTTDNDSFPTVFLEAWASQTPIIAARIGALTSLIESGRTGILTRPSSPYALAKSINTLLADTQLTRTLKKNGLYEVRAKFTWEKSVASTIDLLNDLQKKSLLYVANFKIDNNSAPSIHVVEVCNNLVQQGMNVTLIVPGISKKVTAIFKVRTLRTSSFLSPLTYQMRLFFVLIKAARSNRPDYLYVRQETFMLAPALVAKILRLPLISEVNGLIEEQILSDKRLRLKFIWRRVRVFYLIEKIAYKNSQKIIVVTEGLKNNIASKYQIPTKNISVIENGVNLHKLKPLARSKHTDTPTVGYVGSLVPWQGLEYLIRAIAVAVESLPNIKLVIAGKGPEEAKLKALVKELKLGKRVRFLGLIDHSDAASVINSFDVCVTYYTKDRDGMNSPFKVYEYLACGKPVIVSDVKGLSDKFTSVTCAAKPENATDLASKIVTLINDKKRRCEMSKAATEYISNGHTWADVAKNIRATLGAIK